MKKGLIVGGIILAIVIYVAVTKSAANVTATDGDDKRKIVDAIFKKWRPEFLAAPSHPDAIQTSAMLMQMSVDALKKILASGFDAALPKTKPPAKPAQPVTADSNIHLSV